MNREFSNAARKIELPLDDTFTDNTFTDNDQERLNKLEKMQTTGIGWKPEMIKEINNLRALKKGGEPLSLEEITERLELNKKQTEGDGKSWTLEDGDRLTELNERYKQQFPQNK